MSKDLPSIPERVESDLRRALVRMREELQSLLGLRGSDPAVRLKQVTWGSSDGTLVLLPGSGGGGSSYEPDLTPPPTPTFDSGDVQAGISQVIVTWDGITYTQGHGNKQTIVYAVQKDPSDPTMPTFPGDAGIVAVAPQALTIISIPSEPNTRWHVWLKFESVDGVLSTSPAGGTNGVQATTGQDVEQLLAVLAGQITESELYSALGARIDLIDAADTVAGSVAARVKVVSDNLTVTNGNVTTLSAQVNHATTGLPATRALLLSDYTTSVGLNSALSSLTTTLQAYADTAEADAVATAQTYTNNYAFSYAEGSAMAGTVSTISTAVNSPTTENNPTYAAVQTEISTRTSLTNGLLAQWTVKLDVNGYVSGFGLASTAGNATPTSAFIVRADSFAVASPSGPGITPVVPFIVRTTTSYEGGVAIPPGVYMDAAYIVNLTALYARIATLVADSIYAANISVAQLTGGVFNVGAYIQSSDYTSGPSGTGYKLTSTSIELPATAIRGKLSASQINTWGLEVRDTSGNLILGSGSPLPIGYAPAGTRNSAIAFGGNLLRNSDFRHGRDGWTYGDVVGISQAENGVNLDGNWTLANGNTLFARQAGTANNQNYYFAYYSDLISVEPYKTYCASAYTGAHRCVVSVFIMWYDSAGANAGWSQSATSYNSAEAAGGNTLSGYKRCFSIGNAPANAVTARVFLRKYDTYAGQGDSWLFATRAQFEQVGADATEPGPWTPTGLVGKITPANVSTYIDNVAIGTAQIGNAAITNAKIGGDIWSNDFSYGSAGWIIRRDGYAEFSNVKVRGDVQANSVTANSIYSEGLRKQVATNSIAVTGNYTSAVWAFLNISSSDIPQGESTIPVLIVGSADTTSNTYFDLSYDSTAYGSPGNIVAALPPAGVSSFAYVLNLPAGNHSFMCYNHGSDPYGPVYHAASRTRTITASVFKR